VAAKADVAPPRAIVIIGVSGCGKSTLAAALARSWGSDFVEADDLHDAAAVAKMAGGQPLSDEDRWPWLDRIAARIIADADHGAAPVIATCSALKHRYRERLRVRIGGVVGFVHLRVPRGELERRIAQRADHFMPVSLLDSQLAALELPEGEPYVLELAADEANPIRAIERHFGIGA
jgi:gluconokinase